MTKIFSVLAVVIGIAGCASSAQQATATAAADVSGTGVVAGTDVNESAATDAGTVDDSSPTELEFMDSPEVEKVASVTARREEMICKRIQITGSHRMEKVCRPRYEVDETMKNAQEAVRRLERNAAKSMSR